jgi:hypothetical protein
MAQQALVGQWLLKLVGAVHRTEGVLRWLADWIPLVAVVMLQCHHLTVVLPVRAARCLSALLLLWRAADL